MSTYAVHRCIQRRCNKPWPHRSGSDSCVGAPEVKSGHITVRMDPDELAELKSWAATAGVKLSAMVQRCVRAGLPAVSKEEA